MAGEGENLAAERVAGELLPTSASKPSKPSRMSVAPAASRILTPASGAISPTARHSPLQRCQAHLAIDADRHAATQLDLAHAAALAAAGKPGGSGSFSVGCGSLTRTGTRRPANAAPARGAAKRRH